MAMHLEVGGGRTVVVTEPTRGRFPDNLGGAIEYSLSHVIYKTLEIMGGALGSFMAGVLINFLDRIEPELVEYVAPLLDMVLDCPELPPQLRTFLEGIRNPTGQAGAMLLSNLGGAAGGAAIGGVVSTLLAPTTMFLNRWIHPFRPSPAESFALQSRGLLPADLADRWLEDTGIPDEIRGNLSEIVRPRAGAGDLIAHAWRKYQDPERIRDEMRARGYLDEDIDKLIELSTFLPGTGDLVSMAVREAWRDDIAAKYGYDADFPPEFAQYAAKRGMSADWCKRYWRAHWSLPGPTMAREMLHRTDMTLEDYETLLRIADYPQTFRKWMTEVAYTPFTRVDVRRMYKLGVIPDIAGVITAYKDIGYNDEKAGKLAEFTIMEYGEEERDATKADVVAAYSLGRLSAVETKTILLDLGYQDWIADLYLARADLKESNALAAEVIKHTKTMYTNRQISRVDAVGKLAALPLPGPEIDRYIEAWDITRLARVGRPSRSELKALFLDNVLDEADFRTELAGHKLSDRYIGWIVEGCLVELTDLARKEQERALKEAERLSTAEVKTEKDVTLAGLDVEIADANLAIADIKLNMFALETYEDIDAAKLQIVEYKRLLAQLRKDKAEVRKAYLEARLEGL